jgi:DNA repair protein RecO (recombination protein O)
MSGTNAIMIHSRESGEGDIIARVLTEDAGLILCVFKGLKKSSRRSKAVIDSGTFIHLVIPRISEEKASVVQEATVIYVHQGIRASLRKIVHLNLFSELVLKLIPQNPPDTYTYRMLKAALDTLDCSGNEYHLSLFFTIHLLRTQGILPSFEKCASCGKNDASDYHLSMSEKNILCGVCARIPKESFLRVSGPQRNFALHALSRKYSACDTTLISEDEASTLLFSLLMYTEHYYHTEFRTKTFLFSDDILKTRNDIM